METNKDIYTSLHTSCKDIETLSIEFTDKVMLGIEREMAVRVAKRKSLNRFVCIVFSLVGCGGICGGVAWIFIHYNLGNDIMFNFWNSIKSLISPLSNLKLGETLINNPVLFITGINLIFLMIIYQFIIITKHKKRII